LRVGSEAARERAVRNRLTRLHDAGLIARSEVTIESRRGRRTRLYAVAPRGLEYLRVRHSDLRPDQEPPAYLRPERAPARRRRLLLRRSDILGADR
jgi:hypothetical protein